MRYYQSSVEIILRNIHDNMSMITNVSLNDKLMCQLLKKIILEKTT